jgi:hypothetical protein
MNGLGEGAATFGGNVTAELFQSQLDVYNSSSTLLLIEFVELFAAN